MRVLPVGRHALLVELDDQAAVLGLHAEIERRRASPQGWPWPAPRDVVPAARTLLLDGLADPAAVAAEIVTWRPAPVTTPDGPLVHCPTVYDGPDLAEVADCWGVSPREVVEIHTATEFWVAFCGFAPGFGYLRGLPDGRTVPRRATARPRVPAGSVALAADYGAVYPSDSPGGWQLIGHTELVLFDPRREPAALLTPGVRVRFAEIAA